MKTIKRKESVPVYGKNVTVSNGLGEEDNNSVHQDVILDGVLLTSDKIKGLVQTLDHGPFPADKVGSRRARLPVDGEEPVDNGRICSDEVFSSSSKGLGTSQTEEDLKDSFLRTRVALLAEEVRTTTVFIEDFVAHIRGVSPPGSGIC